MGSKHVPSQANNTHATQQTNTDSTCRKRPNQPRVRVRVRVCGAYDSLCEDHTFVRQLSSLGPRTVAWKMPQKIRATTTAFDGRCDLSQNSVGWPETWVEMRCGAKQYTRKLPRHGHGSKICCAHICQQNRKEHTNTHPNHAPGTLQIRVPAFFGPPFRSGKKSESLT